MPATGIELLGIDNVMFRVDDLDRAIAFYEGCGFVLKFRVEEKRMALLMIGTEEPGLVLRNDEGMPGGRLWVEVRDAVEVAAILTRKGLATRRIETATGITCEVQDPWGNVVGFADYTRMPALARDTVTAG